MIQYWLIFCWKYTSRSGQSKIEANKTWLRQDCLQDFHPRRNWDETSSKILYKTGTSSRFPVTLVPCEKQIRKNDQSACTLSQFLSGDKFLVFLFILIQSTNCDALWSAHANMIKCILLIKEILIFGTLVLFSFLQSEPLSHILQIISSQCTFFCSKLGINGCKVLIVEDYPILLRVLQDSVSILTPAFLVDWIPASRQPRKV